jgi:hypothetical protein
VKVPPEYKGAYEEGCPARGQYTTSGECEDNGEEDASKLCWASTRYEMGKNAPCKEVSDCKCIRSSENGNETLNNKYMEINDGKEIRMQKYLVQPKMECDKCADHDCNPNQCNRCEFCEYGTKTFGNRVTEGCFDIPAKNNEVKKNETGRLFMDGDQPTEEDLIVVPHYPLWNPGGTRSLDAKDFIADSRGNTLSFPYQSRQEPLSKKGWLEEYEEAAPKIQRLMDTARDNIVAAGEAANTLSCSDDIATRLRNFKLARKHCHDMQETVSKLAPHTPFSDHPSGEVDHTPDDAEKDNYGVKCKLKQGKMYVVGGKNCIDLVCYYNDGELAKALFDLNARDSACKPIRVAHCIKHNAGPPEDQRKGSQTFDTVSLTRLA